MTAASKCRTESWSSGRGTPTRRTILTSAVSQATSIINRALVEQPVDAAVEIIAAVATLVETLRTDI